MADDIPDWARQRMLKLAGEGADADLPWSKDVENAFARYIAQHEEPPVDPLLIEAREIAAKVVEKAENDGEEYDWSRHCRSGSYDDRSDVQIALAALKRGMELEREASS